MRACELNYISFDTINKQKWDALVENAENSSVFCYSWYLDSFCTWDAIILGDYEGAIALPFIKKWKFNTIYQPPFIQKCEWFGISPNATQKKLIETLMLKNSLLVRFNSNINWGTESKLRINLILHLKDYNLLKAGYSKSLTKNIAKGKRELEIREVKNIDNVVTLYADAYGSYNKHLTKDQYTKLVVLTDRMNDNFLCKEVYKEGELVAALLFVLAKNRVHYILGAPTERGRKHNALSVALDSIIEEFSGRGYIMDFEGSSIPSVKKFYESFGSINEPFQEIKLSKPWIKPLLYCYNKFFKS